MNVIMTVLMGTNLTLDCTIPNNHTHFVQWTRNGFGLGFIHDGGGDSLPLFGFPRYSMLYNNSLHIHQVSFKDEGDYQCQVGLPVPVMSKSIHVQVRYEPLKPHLSYDGLLVDHHITRFHCSSRGFPLPKITWWLNDYLLEEDYSVINTTTTITSFLTLFIDADNHHLSTLSCFSTNSLGRQQESMILETYAIPKITTTTTTTICPTMTCSTITCPTMTCPPESSNVNSSSSFFFTFPFFMFMVILTSIQKC